MEPEVKNNLSMPIAIVIAGLVIAAAIYFGGSQNTAKPVVDNDQPKVQAVNIKNVKIGSDPFIGNPNAPVVIAYWFDYQCPFCQLSEKNIFTPLVDEYVKTGKVMVVIKDFQFLSQDSQTLGLNARAIWEAYPDKFYEWYKTIFENQGQENTGWATKAVINDLTKKVPGIDQAVVDALIVKNQAKYQKAMDDDRKEAASFGINGTPGFIIADQLIPGVPQYAQLKAYIESQLK
jgi:protein-disulfide isomerase